MKLQAILDSQGRNRSWTKFREVRSTIGLGEKKDLLGQNLCKSDQYWNSVQGLTSSFGKEIDRYELSCFLEAAWFRVRIKLSSIVAGVLLAALYITECWVLKIRRNTTTSHRIAETLHRCTGPIGNENYYTDNTPHRAQSRLQLPHLPSWLFIASAMRVPSSYKHPILLRCLCLFVAKNKGRLIIPNNTWIGVICTRIAPEPPCRSAGPEFGESPKYLEDRSCFSWVDRSRLRPISGSFWWHLLWNGDEYRFTIYFADDFLLYDELNDASHR